MFFRYSHMDEIWRSIFNYEVSTRGSVRNPRTGRILKPGKYKNGYLSVDLCENGIEKFYSVHRLVAMAFPDLVDWTEDAKGKPFEELTVNHLNEDKSDNRVENLQWCPLKKNIKYGTGIKRRAKAQTKTVYQCTLNGKLCGLWPSTAECHRQTGWDNGTISKCCNGINHSYKGFKWSYESPKPPKALPLLSHRPQSS